MLLKAVYIKPALGHEDSQVKNYGFAWEGELYHCLSGFLSPASRSQTTEVRSIPFIEAIFSAKAEASSSIRMVMLRCASGLVEN